ncbi:hypothetical protein VZ95_03120 [Elstera litoralis]|uniref:DUF4410 domain-containing protein n=1 Tax=Elstera litoralis TaxID=552518 RepID=A0A0F3IVN7_9PROT|nr:hypothetical protein [Elstera litoralis]KJV10697.1 hypothetical protein VZ95_03120 [Elstera litoralis]
MALGCLALAGCTTTPSARPVASPAVLPPGASRIAVEISIEIIDTLRDVTQRTDRQELDDYVNAAMMALVQKLAAEKLELVQAPAAAPVQMRLALKVRRNDPIIGGLSASAQATLTDDAGRELLTATGSDGHYMMKTIRNTTTALRKSSEQVGDAIVAQVKGRKAT